MSITYDIFRRSESQQEATKNNGSEAPPIESTAQEQSNGNEAPPVEIELSPGPDIEERYQKLRGTLFGGPK
ncbi:MAG: hypothetical protein ACREQ7_19205, partial [Candidatus Binatia bacterium]